jgi:hypothetical protein
MKISLEASKRVYAHDHLVSDGGNEDDAIGLSIDSTRHSRC